MDSERKQEWRRLLIYAAIFAGLFFLPVGVPRFDAAIDESLLTLFAYTSRGALGPMAAALGGWVAQEAIKVRSMSQVPPAC